MYRANPAYSAPRRIPRRRLRVHVGRVIALVAVSLTVAFQVVSAGQDVFTFTDFSDKSSLTMNGDTPANNPAGQTFLRLTSGTNQAGSAFVSTAVTLTTDASFSTNFSFRILNNVGATDSDLQVGADGITFVVQTVSNTAGGGAAASAMTAWRTAWPSSSIPGTTVPTTTTTATMSESTSRAARTRSGP